ncbi:hypothetical protein AGLY_008196 [Aphis glycines]|uniref:Uncharacterized protein n=1 Tax=Aphis glycines TaxID=307491 RepID=A0A6G0TM07_APHGL|nr:hypothetical protein AGLY_008196 [Aphis glycines]
MRTEEDKRQIPLIYYVIAFEDLIICIYLCFLDKTHRIDSAKRKFSMTIGKWSMFNSEQIIIFSSLHRTYNLVFRKYDIYDKSSLSKRQDSRQVRENIVRSYFRNIFIINEIKYQTAQKALIKSVFPSLYKLIQVAISLPIVSAVCERSFSAMLILTFPVKLFTNLSSSDYRENKKNTLGIKLYKLSQMVEDSMEFSWSLTYKRRTLGWSVIIYIRTGRLVDKCVSCRDTKTREDGPLADAE